MKIELDIWSKVNGCTKLSHYSLSEDEILEIIKNHLIQIEYIDENEKVEISSVTV